MRLFHYNSSQTSKGNHRHTHDSRCENTTVVGTDIRNHNQNEEIVSKVPQSCFLLAFSAFIKDEANFSPASISFAKSCAILLNLLGGEPIDVGVGG